MEVGELWAVEGGGGALYEEEASGQRSEGGEGGGLGRVGVKTQFKNSRV